jgi:hypothetical protein
MRNISWLLGDLWDFFFFFDATFDQLTEQPGLMCIFQSGEKFLAKVVSILISQESGKVVGLNNLVNQKVD